MNEKIKQFAEQAGALIEIGEKSHYIMVEPGNGAALEKFAELIVRECIDIALKDATPEWNWTEANTQRKKIAADLQQHFGVEE